MIPVRVQADIKVPVIDRVFDIAPDHPLSTETCPVCDFLLMGHPVVLVVVGIDPETRAEKQGQGWCTGAAVAVHAGCAGVPGG